MFSQPLSELHQEHGRPGGPSQVWEDIVQAQGRPKSYANKILAQMITNSMMYFAVWNVGRKVMWISFLIFESADRKLARISLAGGTLLDGCH